MVPRRAKAIEHELYKRADGGAACAELAAVLQEATANLIASDIAPPAKACLSPTLNMPRPMKSNRNFGQRT
jgi:hypothetical protein